MHRRLFDTVNRQNVDHRSPQAYQQCPLGTVTLHVATMAAWWYIHSQDEQNLKQNEGISRASSLRRSLVGDVPSIIQHRDSVDGAMSPGPWDAVSPSSNSFSSTDGMLSARASAFARVSSCSGRSPEVSGSPWALPASKQQLLSAKRTASGRLAADVAPDAGLARPPDSLQQQRSVKKSSSLREGSGFVHNALAVGRGLLQQEGLIQVERH